MAKVNKKTLAAQSAVNREMGSRLATTQIAAGAAGEQARGLIQSGLGSAAQMSGAYSGAQARDLSKYSTGLNVTGSKSGDTAATAAYLSKARGAETVLQEAKYDKKGNLKRAAITLGDVAAGTAKYKGGQTLGPGMKIGGVTQVAAAQELKQRELYGQVQEVNALYQQAYDAAKAGDYDAADQLQAQAAALSDQYSLNEGYDATGLAGGGTFNFQTGQKFDPLFNPQGQAEQALGSPTGMLVGGVVNKAREMLDPNSAEAMRFKDSLTSGALAAVDNARTQAIRAMGSQERGAARERRDVMMQSGAANATAKNAALAARSSERFATLRATVEGDVAAQRAQIHSEASKFYESFKYDLAQDAHTLASAWVNDMSGVRDNFRAIQNNLVTNYVNNLFGFAGTATSGSVDLAIAGKQAQGAASGGAASGIGGAVGTVLGAVIGAVA